MQFNDSDAADLASNVLRNIAENNYVEARKIMQSIPRDSDVREKVQITLQVG